MAFTINEKDVVAEPAAVDVTRQRLLTRQRVPETKVLLERLNLAPGAELSLRIEPTSLAWLQVLSGQVVLDDGSGGRPLDSDHIVFLPPAYRARLESPAGAAVLHAEVPDAARLDPEFAQNPPAFRLVDWTREPVLDSKHDARKRIYVATPKLFGTRAIKGEMIIYPPGTAGADHHHEGAEHFMYVLKGSGTAYAGSRAIPVRRGDLICYDDRERHWLRADDGAEMAFVEFFVPGVYKTVWAQGAPICTWLPTGHDIRGNKPAREIAAHSGAQAPGSVDV